MKMNKKIFLLNTSNIQIVYFISILIIKKCFFIVKILFLKKIYRIHFFQYLTKQVKHKYSAK